MISEDDHCRPLGELLEPPTETIDELWGDALCLGMNDIPTDDDQVGTQLMHSIEEVLEYLGVLIVTLQSAPVDVGDMCDLNQRMLPLLIILERLIIP